MSMINDSDRHPHPVALRFVRAELDSILTEREALVIKARFGLNTGVYCQHCNHYTPTATSKTLEEVANDLRAIDVKEARTLGINVDEATIIPKTRERVRQIEAKALRKLKGAVAQGLIENTDDFQDAFLLLSRAVGIQAKTEPEPDHPCYFDTVS